ncbi:glutamine amidotransferase [Niastella yeongjuensis]|uniref:Glutamine amidotransferase n=1 Tax=Niastella yeongjuensis TaxID=354355 RepID=A0A1V9EDY3_9BACT|nr:type 1 glutamine amidotransferase domain-containing protein [Niastella yeongjuensis]OQP44174.1 glutamine amidotransferase [Niastella yeongjuensis]SEP22047.1 Putative intracellular protease/amidase [Niastella yeongjuensis]
MNTSSLKAAKGKVLLVTSSVDSILLKDGANAVAGFYLNELTIPMEAVVAAVYDIVLATPRGNKPVLDRSSATAAHFDNSEEALQRALEFVEKYPAMQNPVTLQSVVENGLDEYIGVFVPGGHPPMVDLMQDPYLGEILEHFHNNAKPSAFLCHGPISIACSVRDAKAFRAALTEDNIAAAKKASEDWQYAGYRMTVFSNDEEHYAEKNVFGGHKAPFYVADALTIAGGKLEFAEGGIFKPHAVVDRELITGQNPPSAPELARLFVKALNEISARVEV